MDTNLKSSTLLRQDNSDKHKSHNSLTLIPADKPERSTQQHQKSVSQIYSAQAWIYFQEQNWQRAIVACKNALESDSRNADAFKILGNIFKIQGKKAEALGVYAKALQINPDSAPIYANLGSFYAEQKDWEQALDYFQQAVILDPKFAGAYRSLAQVWEELGDNDRALECLCQAVNLEPEKLTAPEYFSFGQKLHQQGKIKEASIFYTQGIKLHPHAKSELAQLVKMLEQLGEWQQAVAYYHQLISLSSDRPESNLSSDKPIKNLLFRSRSKIKSPGNVPDRFQSDKVERSLKVISSSAINVPQLSPAEDRSQSARTERDSSVKQPSAASWNNLGSQYAQKQQWAKAVSCYQEAIQLEPNLGKIYRNLARVYDKIGQKTKANLCWYKSLTVEPATKPEAYFDLAKNLLEQSQVEQAIACLRRVVELKPDFKKAYLILGKLLETQGKSAAAQACYQKLKTEAKQK